jgi:Asp-tRNA(Asn)/Glu-tRNA(Gln) amidotransferase A subunit family amidase
MPLNAIQDFIIEPALDFARDLDQERRDGKVRSPLHGLPISIKSNIFIKGYESHIGLISELNQPSKEDALLVQCLQKLGCIPFLRSNVPTASLSNDCYNHITGGVQNPFRADRSPGGSSGGEAS